MEAAGVSKDGQPVQAAEEVELGKVDGNRRVGSWIQEDRSGSSLGKEDHGSRTPSNNNGGIAN